MNLNQYCDGFRYSHNHSLTEFDNQFVYNKAFPSKGLKFCLTFISDFFCLTFVYLNVQNNDKPN